MHWIEGMVVICAGAIPWLIAGGAFPRDAQQRARLERLMPVIGNQRLMRATAIFLWLFGGLVAANDLLGLGLPL